MLLVNAWALAWNNPVEQGILKCAYILFLFLFFACVSVGRKWRMLWPQIYLFERILLYLRNTVQDSMLSSTGIDVQLYLGAHDLWAQTSKVGMMGKKWWATHEYKRHVNGAKLLIKCYFYILFFSLKVIHVHCVKDRKHSGIWKQKEIKFTWNPTAQRNMHRVGAYSSTLLSCAYVKTIGIVKALDTYWWVSFSTGCRAWLQSEVNERVLATVSSPLPTWSIIQHRQFGRQIISLHNHCFLPHSLRFLEGRKWEI